MFELNFNSYKYIGNILIYYNVNENHVLVLK